VLSNEIRTSIFVQELREKNKKKNCESLADDAAGITLVTPSSHANSSALERD